MAPADFRQAARCQQRSEDPAAIRVVTQPGQPGRSAISPSGRDKSRAFDNLRLKELGGVPYLPGRGRLLILPTTSTTIGTPSISGGNSTPPAGCSLRFIFTA